MNTEQLESFIAVAENLNFARAAESLNITQSAVSRQIHSLEEELGVKLFHRSTRLVALTPAGLSFLEDARSVMIRLEAAKSRLRHHEEAEVQILTIGCGSELYMAQVEEILKKCRQNIPELHPLLKMVRHKALLNLFYQGEMEVMFGSKEDIPARRDITYRELAQMPMCAVLPASHPLADRETLGREELQSESLAVCMSYSIPQKASDFINRTAKQLSPEEVSICDELQLLFTLVKAGYGISVLPQIQNPDPDLRFIPLNGVQPLSFGVYYKKESMTPLLKKFPPVRLDAPGSIQPAFKFAKLALSRFCGC